MEEKIIIVDFGSQYTQLIARRVRELNVYCEIFPYNEVSKLRDDVKGIILSGSPYSVKDKNSPRLDLNKNFSDLPILGICYGAQLIAKSFNCKITQSKIREYGRANLKLIKNNSIVK